MRNVEKRVWSGTEWYPCVGAICTTRGTETVTGGHPPPSDVNKEDDVKEDGIPPAGTRRSAGVAGWESAQQHDAITDPRAQHPSPLVTVAHDPRSARCAKAGPTVASDTAVAITRAAARAVRGRIDITRSDCAGCVPAGSFGIAGVFRDGRPSAA
jgi:hypothetical protein